MRNAPLDSAWAHEEVVDVGALGHSAFSDAVDRRDHRPSGPGYWVMRERDERASTIDHLLNAHAHAEDAGVDSALRAVEHRSDAEDRRGAGRNAVDQRAGANVKVAIGQPRERVGGIVFTQLTVAPDNACADRDVVQAEADAFLQDCGLQFPA